MRHATVVACRRHAVVAHQALIALGEVVAGVTVEIAECRRQAVAAMLVRHAAERRQGFLQAFRQSHEAFTAEHDVSVLEARECQPEVVKTMVQRDAADCNAEPVGVGEVGEAETAGLVLLSEDDVLLRPGQGAPGAHPPFQRAPHTRAISGWQRRISSRTAMARRPGAAFRSGRISPSHTSASGSGRRRPRGVCF